MEGPLVLVLFIALAAGVMLIGWWQAKKRREAFAQLAAELGFTYAPAKDRAFARRYSFLENMDDGSNRYVFNLLSGTVEDQAVHIFDYHYETYSRDSKGRRRTSHHYYSIFILALPAAFPELTLRPEGFFSKIGQALGFDDIDFESHEFSRRYAVRSRDKKFAYDFCNAQMIDYLLAQETLAIEVEGPVLSLAFRGRLAVERIRPNLERLRQIRSLMPNYLFTFE